MSAQEGDHNFSEPMDGTDDTNAGNASVGDQNFENQVDEFQETQTQSHDSSALDAFADELNEEFDAQDSNALENGPQESAEAELGTPVVLHSESSVQERDIHRATSAAKVIQAPEEDQHVASPSAEQISIHDMEQQPQEREQQHDSTSLFVPQHDPSATDAPTILGTKSVPRSLVRSTIMSHFKDSRAKLRRPNAAGSKSKSVPSGYPRPSPAGPQQGSLDSTPNNSSGSAAHEGRENIDEEDKFHLAAAQTYESARQHYDRMRRKNNGRLPMSLDIEWAKIQSAEDARKKKRKRDLEINTREEGSLGENLFPEDPMIGEREEDDHEAREVGKGSSRKRQRPDQPQKVTKQVSLVDAELQSMKVALDATGDLPKSKKRGKASATDESQNAQSSTSKSSKSKGKSKVKNIRPGASKGKGNAGSRKTAKQKRDLLHGQNIATSLLTHDIFRNQVPTDAPEQPTFTSKNKKEALKELIASVPLDVQKSAQVDRTALGAATRDFNGKGAASPDGKGMWIVKGMRTSLKPHQLLGTAFMRRQENSIEQPAGGLLADAMGLGKTLMTLACIVNGRGITDQKDRTTLLVASPNLLNQWAREIDLHTACKPPLKIMRFTSGNRLDSTEKFDIFRQHDIILTTYAEVMKSYPKNEPPVQCQTVEEKVAWWMNTYENDRGPLHRMQFLRVVLDEAQAIKNHTSRTSIACRALMAHHRWALTGTPIQNTLVELYPYFKFLNVPHTGSLRIFKNNYCDSKNSASIDRLLLRLQSFMIRRQHSDTLFGAPILKLPRAEQITHWCDFNPVELNIYDIVRSRFAKRINVWSQKGELERSYSNALVMLLRLRQLTAHVLMLQFVMRDLLEREDIERISQVIEESSIESNEYRNYIIAVRKQLAALAEEEKRKGDRTAKPDQDADEEPDGLGDNLQQTDDYTAGKGFGTDYNFKPYLKSLTSGESWQKAKKKAICGACKKEPENPWLTQCNHLLCTDCYEEALIRRAEEDRSTSICSTCGQPWRMAHECDGDSDDDQQLYERRETRSQAKKNKQRIRPEREDIKEDWLSLGGGKVLPSAKTIAIKAQILNWIKENPNIKIIVYTQFLAMIKILDRVCTEEGWRVEHYHGKMSFNARDKAIMNFQDDPDVRVLLSSLRTGGLGLNLTMASRVIVVDPWWNAAAEQQAFCRVYRIGQTETTCMTRFCVRNTVDERLIKMQERKTQEIDEVMDDDGERTKKMNIRDLMRLFGPVSEDSEGKPFIWVDDPPAHSGFRACKDDEGYANDD